jgi:hypothetical protein
MQSAQPSQPKKVRVSLRNIEDKMAQITTDKAPKGVLKEHFNSKKEEKAYATYYDDGLHKSISCKYGM